jgi:serine/threonine-protein kinase 24/25/MST4
MRSEWNFDTIKSTAMGTLSSMVRDLPRPQGTDEGSEEYPGDDGSFEEGQGSFDTSAATQGSEPLTKSASGIGLNAQASHSTVVIRQPQTPGEEQDVVALVASAEAGSSAEESSGPEIPPQNGFPENITGPPPAYTGSMRSTNRRASYKARNAVNGPGTIIGHADLGSGVDTIRPVKKVDAVGSLKLSTEFVGSARREANASSPPSLSPKDRRSASEAARAGKSIVDEVILPLLQNVCVSVISNIMLNLTKKTEYKR